MHRLSKKQGASTQGTWSDIYSLGKILEYLIMNLGYKNDPSTRTSQEAYEIGLTLIDGTIDKQKIMDIISRACKESIKHRLQNVHELNKIIGEQPKRLSIKKSILAQFCFINMWIIIIFYITTKKMM